jgi:hypothetical protein
MTMGHSICLDIYSLSVSLFPDDYCREVSMLEKNIQEQWRFMKPDALVMKSSSKINFILIF